MTEEAGTGYFFSLSKSAAKIGLDDSEWALLIFGILLAMGIVGEIKHGMWGKSEHWFAMLVLWAVLGEVVSDGGIFLFSSQLQIISDSEISVLNGVTANARTQAEKLRKDNLLLQADVLRLELRTKFRHLTPEQQREIGSKLKPFHGIVFSIVIFNVGDDGQAIADNIATALGGPSEAAGWAGGIVGTSSASSPEPGILIAVNPEATAFVRKAANELAEALRQEGLFVPPVRASPYPPSLFGAINPAKGDIGISIGRRP
jgi:hypothetical protein